VGTDIAPAAIACAKAHAELDALGLPVGATANFDADGLPVESATGHGEPMAECGAVAGPNAMTCTGARSANIHFGDEAPDRWGARFDLVVANILEAPLHGLAPALSRALVPGGVLLISGFTRPQAPALRLAYETTGLKSAGDFSLDDWVLLKFRADQSFSAM
jgi:ribosomal protein L11 methylase PrmA